MSSCHLILGKQIFSSKTEFRISALKFHPTESNVFVCGGFSPEVKAWDLRTSKVKQIFFLFFFPLFPRLCVLCVIKVLDVLTGLSVKCYSEVFCIRHCVPIH